ncbi:MAG: chemotaxis protein CheX [Clostridia bacterium]|nr:chemotaxis protein CheX [Clostridia bacterium]
MNPVIIDTFIQSTINMFKEMVDLQVTQFGDLLPGEDYLNIIDTYASVSFSGKFRGRFILDVNHLLGLKICSNLMAEEVLTLRNKLNLSGISELTNTISGDAITSINNTYHSGLRLAPPVVATGKNLGVAKIKMESVTIQMNTDSGPFKINIAVEGGEIL